MYEDCKANSGSDLLRFFPKPHKLNRGRKTGEALMQCYQQGGALKQVC